jgi:hypothetical protein
MIDDPRRDERELVSPSDTLGLASQLRELTGFEEDWILSDGKRARSLPAACHEVLARCLSRPGEPHAEMLERVRALGLAQRDWLLIELRSRSFGSRIKGEVLCPRCGSAEEIEFAASDLPIQPPADNRPLVIHLPSGRDTRLRRLAAGDHEQFAATPGLDGAAQMALALGRSLVSLQGELDSLEDEDRKALEQALASSVPEELRIDIDCHGCGQQLAARFGACAFFLGELREHSKTLIDDVHTLARTYHWSEADVLRLPLRRRLAYLLRIEAEQDAAMIQTGG